MGEEKSRALKFNGFKEISSKNASYGSNIIEIMNEIVTDIEVTFPANELL